MTKKPPKRVLVADDDPVITTVLSALLKRHGWHVQVVRDAMQAVMYAAREPSPDLIVLDLSMPAGSGFSSLERLRASSRTEQIPIVVLTGSVEPGVEARVLDLGATAFVRKPIDPDAFAALLEQVLHPPAADGSGDGS